MTQIIELSDQTAAALQALVEDGRFASTDDAVRCGIDLVRHAMNTEDHWGYAIGELRTLVKEGQEGEGVAYDRAEIAALMDRAIEAGGQQGDSQARRKSARPG